LEANRGLIASNMATRRLEANRGLIASNMATRRLQISRGLITSNMAIRRLQTSRDFISIVGDQIKIPVIGVDLITSKVLRGSRNLILPPRDLGTRINRFSQVLTRHPGFRSRALALNLALAHIWETLSRINHRIVRTRCLSQIMGILGNSNPSFCRWKFL